MSARRGKGWNNALDSDIDPISARSICTGYLSGETDLTIDAGIFVPVALGDFVWLDFNGNGLQDLGEPGAPGAIVNLYDASTNFLASTMTDAFGAYTFTNLVPGTYSVEFIPIGPFVLTLREQGGDDAIDSDPDPLSGFTAPVSLPFGSNLTIDSVGDFVWEDLNADGIQDPGETNGIPGISVVLFDGQTTNALATNVPGVTGSLFLYGTASRFIFR